jgi:hypothetical protein
MKGDAARAGADVQYATSREAECAALVLGPAPERQEVAPWPACRLDEAVVALDDLVGARFLLEVREQQRAVGVLLGR